MNRFDYIVVGGGSAGCVVAARLSEDPKVKVLLLEAGDDERKFFRVRMPLAWRDAFRDPRLSWGFETEPEPHLDGRRVPAPRGKVLGGSNSVNGLMYMRGCPADYDDWAKRGLPGWDYAGVLPYFRRSESNWRGASRFHGGTGPLTTARYETDDFIYPRVIDTAEALGFKHLEDFHAEDIEGFTVPDCNYHGGERASTVARYLRPAMSRANLEVRINTLTRALILESNRCVGVHVESYDGDAEIRCEREVILCAGTFNSPQLLQLSGIGAPQDLEPQGIRVRHALPGVGANLQDHQSMSVDYTASGEFCFDSQLRLDRLALSVLQWKMFRNGILARSPISAQGLVRTAPHLDRPDLQMLVAPVSIFARPWFPGWRKGVGHTVSNPACCCTPKAAARCRCARPTRATNQRSSSTCCRPKPIEPDCATSSNSCAGSLPPRRPRSWSAQEVTPGPQVQSDAEIDAWLRANVRTAMHPTSTCAMGTDGMAVVDGQLRVHGLSGLRIADASIMPAIVGGNTNAPTIMIAEKAADLIRGTGV